MELRASMGGLKYKIIWNSSLKTSYLIKGQRITINKTFWIIIYNFSIKIDDFTCEYFLLILLNINIFSIKNYLLSF